MREKNERERILWDFECTRLKSQLTSFEFTVYFRLDLSESQDLFALISLDLTLEGGVKVNGTS
jgi:hypothetical protein